jgi:2-oxoacid:acceptor oxidoreductase gamma subunit (pyruvate/2-ketoisovalerate family)
MIQTRIHGRGGQGVVTSAELIAIAAFKAGKESQAFPSFGVERTGAPVEAYARIDTKPIRVREQIYHPDIIIIQDETLIGTVDVSKGGGLNTKIIINSKKSSAELSALLNIPAKNISVLDATQIAIDIFGKNIVNTVILGAFAKITGLITFEQLKSAIHEKFEEKGQEIIDKNIKAVEEAYKII